MCRWATVLGMLFLLDTSMTLTNSIAAVQTVRLNCWLIYWLSANLSCVVAVCPDVSTKLGTCNYSNQWKLTRVKLCEVKSHRLGLIYQNTSMICIKTVIFQLQRNQMCLQCVWIAWFCPLKKKTELECFLTAIQRLNEPNWNKWEIEWKLRH